MQMPKIIFRTVSGNVIGIVEQPDELDPVKPIGEQCIVRIGVRDRRGPLPKKNALRVIEKLRGFVETLIGE